MSVAGTDLWRMSATDLAGAIRSRQASSREVIETHLWWIEAVNPSINAVTILLAGQALEAAGSTLLRTSPPPLAGAGNP
jgi:amidase